MGLKKTPLRLTVQRASSWLGPLPRRTRRHLPPQAAHEKVAQGALPRSKLEKLERAHGLNFNPQGLLADVALRGVIDPVATLTYDWVHSALQDGVFTEEASRMLQALGPFGIRQTHLREFFADATWRFPAHARTKASTLYRVFDSHRSPGSEPGTLKCSAAELLGLYGLLRHFVATRTANIPSLSPQVASFQAACRSLDLVMLSKRGVADPAQASDMLQAAVVKHLRLHIAAYGTGGVRPKHHWMLHVADQFRRDGVVLDAFIIERIHLQVRGHAREPCRMNPLSVGAPPPPPSPVGERRRTMYLASGMGLGWPQVKRIAEHVDNTVVFERSVLKGLLNRHFAQIATPEGTTGLRGRTAKWPGAPWVSTADRLVYLALQALFGAGGGG